MYQFALVAYKANGELDPDFNNGTGKVVTGFTSNASAWANAIAIDSQRRLVVGGWDLTAEGMKFALARYDKHGILDTAFSHDGDGKVVTDFSTSRDEVIAAIAIASKDRIVAAGNCMVHGHYQFALARYKSTGELDSSFGDHGKTTTDFGLSFGEGITDVIIDHQERILVAGWADSKFALARYHSGGGLDTSFGNQGKLMTAFAGGGAAGFAIAIDLHEKILVAGTANVNGSDRFALARYDDHGLDTTFQDHGMKTQDFDHSTNEMGLAMEIDKHNRIVVAGTANVAGQSRFAVARYHLNGDRDTSFTPDGKVTTPFEDGNAYGNALAIDSQSRIVVAGASQNAQRFAVARYTVHGELDSAFNTYGKVRTSFPHADAAQAEAVAIDEPSGRIIAAGWASVASAAATP